MHGEMAPVIMAGRPQHSKGDVVVSRVLHCKIKELFDPLACFAGPSYELLDFVISRVRLEHMTSPDGIESFKGLDKLFDVHLTGTDIVLV